MAKDPASGSVSNPDGGTYSSSEEVRADDAEKSFARSEIINEFGEVICGELLEAGIFSFSGLMIIDDESKEALSPEAKVAIATYFAREKNGPTTIEILNDQNDNPVEETEETKVRESAGTEVSEEVPSDAGEETNDPEISEDETEAVASEGEASDESDAEGDVDIDAVENLEEHEHETEPPMTYEEAQERLGEVPFVELREMAEADGLKPERSKASIIMQLLAAWFPVPPPAILPEQGMSARVRRIKESQEQ